jgi:hypothetical protein
MLTFSMYKPWSNCSTNCHFLKSLLETHNLEFVFLPMYEISLNPNKLLFNIYVKILIQWVKCKWLSYHSTIIIHTKYPPLKKGEFVEKMVTNSFWNKSFMQPMKQFNMHLQKPNYFSFGGVLFETFWECGVFNHVLRMFPPCFHLFPMMFSMHSPCCYYNLPKILPCNLCN